jgi:chemotaxis protein MotB
MAKNRSKSNNESGGGGGAPAWMTTYGDMMTLLLCFFVLLVSFSSIEKSGFDKAMGSLKGALGVLPKHQSVMIQFDPIIPQLSDFQEKRVQKVVSELRNMAKTQGLKDQMSMQQTEDGILIRIDSPVLFDLGSAELKKKSFPVLYKVVELASDWPNSIRIEGHTDNLKIRSGRFPSNWELSTTRALSVLRFFLHQGKVEPQRLKAVGYGEYHPLMSNDTAEGRAKNRRVEIYLESTSIGNQADAHDELFLR